MTPVITPNTLKSFQEAIESGEAFQTDPQVPQLNMETTVTSVGGSSNQYSDESRMEDSDENTSSHSGMVYGGSVSSTDTHFLNTSCGLKSNGTQKSKATPKQTRGSRVRSSQTKSCHEKELSPEEENRKRMRRERNKLAAARCRKRRMDQTSQLQQEVDALDQITQSLRKQMEDLRAEKLQIEACLMQHEAEGCKLKMVPLHNHNQQQMNTHHPVPKTQQNKNCQRPTSLPFNTYHTVSGSNGSNGTSSDSLVPIQTPSNGVTNIFDGLMPEGTGLTPFLETPTGGLSSFIENCVNHQRNTCSEQTIQSLVSPDAAAPHKLVSL